MSKGTAAMVGLTAIIPGIVFRGIALSILWAWFITRLGVREISTAEAIGLCVVLGLVTPNRFHKTHEAQSDDERAEAVGRFLGGAFVSPLFALLMGWIVKSFV